MNYLPAQQRPSDSFHRVARRPVSFHSIYLRQEEKEAHFEKSGLRLSFGELFVSLIQRKKDDGKTPSGQAIYTVSHRLRQLDMV